MEKKKILVIDDEVELLKAIKVRLEGNNYQVITAHNGKEGLERAKEENPDLMIVDVVMAQMDGYTLVRELKQIESTKSIPVIVLTAHAAMKELFEMEGIKDYVIKPYNHLDLLLRISRALKK